MNHWFWYKTIYTKRYKEIRKLTTGKGKYYTTGCLLDYDYTKIHYRLIAVDLSRQKELGADPKAIQQKAIFSRKCNSLTKDDKLSRSKS